MNYTIEDIYLLVGKDDKTAGLSFRPESNAFKKYGDFITVIFIYTQKEREEMDKLILTKPFSNHGFIKAKSLDINLTKEKANMLLKEGVDSKDIIDVLYINSLNPNSFHSKSIRQLTKIEISIEPLPEGRDLDWMYGFSKQLIERGISKSPQETAFYLAGKLYYEPENITSDDSQLIYDESGKLNEAVEWEILQIKYMRKDIADHEKQKLINLYRKKMQKSYKTLDKYLQDAGSSIKKLVANNLNQAVDLFYKVLQFKERRINTIGKYPIYMDVDSYLHIYMRHVQEFQINKHFEHKDNFLWKEEDVFDVMRHVIDAVDKEYQSFREENPEQRFSKYADQSLYFQGDYYIFHIEIDGRISTFHRTKKGFEKRKNKD